MAEGAFLSSLEAVYTQETAAEEPLPPLWTKRRDGSQDGAFV
jgi:hypothetical protein